MNGESFFDESNAGLLEKFTIWKKLGAHEVNGPAIEEIVFQGWLCRTEAGSQSLKERFFVMTNEKLYYKKKPADPTFKGYLSLGFVRLISPSASEIETKEGASTTIRIRFVQNLKFSDLFARSKVELDAWLNALAARVVRVDFHERFKVRAVVGKGAFGKVYLAGDAFGKDFAVKAFSKDVLSKQARGRAALCNEVEILRKLDYSNIMKLYEVHETTNSIYLVCEFLSGGTLTDYLRSSTDFLPDKAVLAIVFGLLAAVAGMASSGIVHRDLKPENLILSTADGEIGPGSVKVVDFGLATRIEGEYLYSRCGTPGYVAPEVVAAEGKESTFRVSSKADIFAVGVVAYLMLTGESPFETGDAKQTLKRTIECKVNYQHPRLREKNPAIINLLRGMLTAKPSTRLSARDAIRSEVFQELGFTVPKFDDSEYPNEEDLGDMDLAAMDEDCRVSESIRSLEARSIAIKKGCGSASDANSIKMDVDDTTRTSNSHNSGNLLKKSILRRMASNNVNGVGNNLQVPLSGGDFIDASPMAGFLSPANTGTKFLLKPQMEDDVLESPHGVPTRVIHTQSATQSPNPALRSISGKDKLGTPARQCSLFAGARSINYDDHPEDSAQEK